MERGDHSVALPPAVTAMRRLAASDVRPFVRLNGGVEAVLVLANIRRESREVRLHTISSSARHTAGVVR
ncbi:hypothetical protein [Acetobacter nitrogenifigens]|uniref:hypothetical protein n=1 Tax=Acetobacter nitrogenifigens TaxID=285268 RepID=UPI0003FBC8E4|nr:hypothetical protein [Acetobacter nitrogenifigens]